MASRTAPARRWTASAARARARATLRRPRGWRPRTSRSRRRGPVRRVGSSTARCSCVPRWPRAPRASDRRRPGRVRTAPICGDRRPAALQALRADPRESVAALRGHVEADRDRLAVDPRCRGDAARPGGHGAARPPASRIAIPRSGAPPRAALALATGPPRHRGAAARDGRSVRARAAGDAGAARAWTSSARAARSSGAWAAARPAARCDDRGRGGRAVGRRSEPVGRGGASLPPRRPPSWLRAEPRSTLDAAPT